MTPELALQHAITLLLLTSPTVNSRVGEQIFDEVPGDRPGEIRVAPPWVYLGPIARRRLEIGCGDAWTITMRLYAASTGFGRSEAWELGGAITDALEGAEPPLPAPFRLVEVLRCNQAGDVVEPTAPKTVFVDVTTIITRDA